MRFENGFGVSLFFFSVFPLFFSFALMMRPAKAYFGLCLYFQGIGSMVVFCYAVIWYLVIIFFNFHGAMVCVII